MGTENREGSEGKHGRGNLNPLSTSTKWPKAQS